MKPFERWTVLPHGKLTEVDDGLLTVVGNLHMPVGDFPRRMTVARLEDGRLVVYSAIALAEDEMQAIERYGEPAFLVVPSAIHRMDAKIWCDRYPDLVVVAPAGARAKVAQVVPVAATHLDLADPHVRLFAVQGTRDREAALLVERAGGFTLVVNDLIWNVAHRPGVGGWFLKVAGFTGGSPRIPPLVAKKSIADRRAFRAALDRWSHLPLRRIIMSHGEIVEGGASEVLRGLSARLAA